MAGAEPIEAPGGLSPRQQLAKGNRPAGRRGSDRTRWRRAEEPGDLTVSQLPDGSRGPPSSASQGRRGFLLALGYSTQRGYTLILRRRNQIGFVVVEVDIPELGFSICIGEIRVTECRWSPGSPATGAVAALHRGYGVSANPTQGHGDEPG